MTTQVVELPVPPPPASSAPAKGLTSRESKLELAGELLKSARPSAAPAPAAKLVDKAPVPDKPAGETQDEKPADGKPMPLNDEEQADYDKARNATRWARIPISVINNADPRELIKWGKEIAKVRAEADENTRQLGELRKEKATWDEAKKPPQPEPTKEPATKVEPFDFKADVAAYSKLDPEAGEALATVLGSVAPKLQAQLLSQMQSGLEASLAQAMGVPQSSTPEKQFKRLIAAVTRLEMQGARAELTEKFPLLRDKGRFESVINRMAKIGNSNFADYRELMEEASAIEFVNELTAKSRQDDLNKEHRSRDDGQGDKPLAPPPKATLTPREAKLQAATEILREHGYNTPAR